MGCLHSVSVIHDKMREYKMGAKYERPFQYGMIGLTYQSIRSCFQCKNPLYKVGSPLLFHAHGQEGVTLKYLVQKVSHNTNTTSQSALWFRLFMFNN